MDRIKIVDKDFDFLRNTFFVDSLFEEIANTIRLILANNSEQEAKEITVDAEFIENYFTAANWRQVFQAALKVVNPQWKDKHDDDGNVVGKYLEDFVTYDDFRQMDNATVEGLKKNLLENLNFAKIQKKPLNLHAKNMISLLKTLEQPTS